MVDLIKQADKVDHLGKATSPERMREWMSQPHCHPERDLLLAELDGTLVGYVNISTELEIGRVILEGVVHPQYRRRGIGTLLLERGIAHSRKLGAALVHIPIPQEMDAAQHLVEKQGFKVVRHHWRMRMELETNPPMPGLPQGLGLRHFLRGDEERLAHIQNLAFAGSWGFCPNSPNEVKYYVGTSLCRHEGILFLTESSNIVGYCWTRLDEERIHHTGDVQGEIWMMGVASQHRGRGLGKALLRAGIGYLGSCGAKAVELTVDSENTAARELYESAGFKRKMITLWYERVLS